MRQRKGEAPPALPRPYPSVKERPKEGKSRMMQILKGAVIAIIVIYAISFLGLILLVNYFPWEGIGTG